METFAFFAITFEPIGILTHSAHQNDRLNLSFVKDKHTYGKKMARKYPTTVVYQYLSFPIRVYNYLGNGKPKTLKSIAFTKLLEERRCIHAIEDN